MSGRAGESKLPEAATASACALTPPRGPQLPAEAPSHPRRLTMLCRRPGRLAALQRHGRTWLLLRLLQLVAAPAPLAGGWKRSVLLVADLKADVKRRPCRQWRRRTPAPCAV